MIITYEQLKRLGACKSQLDLFKETFGVSITLTKQVILDHHKSFDTSWFVSNILTISQKQAYEDARAPLLITVLALD